MTKKYDLKINNEIGNFEIGEKGLDLRRAEKDISIWRQRLDKLMHSK